MSEELPKSPAPEPSPRLRERLAPVLALRAVDVQLYRLADDFSGGLILLMLVFSPWALGTTQPWSIWCMNLGGYGLGGLLLAKLFIRNVKKFPAARWDHFSAHSGILSRRRHRTTRLLVRVLAGLTVAVLAYLLISALNVAADYTGEARTFKYHAYVAWLPHSFDGARTWFYFWMYLGLAASFWAVVDWLPGMTAGEERMARAAGREAAGRSVPLLPGRLRTLLWVLCLSGAVLGAEAILQRASGSTKLLFLVQPRVNREGVAQFGPYAYRSNAAQYFNLLWPLCLGFWWTLQRAGGLRGGRHHWLLLCAAVMAACPVISTSRGGALVAAGILVLAVVYFAALSFFSFAGRARDGSIHWGAAGLVLLFFAATVFLGWYFGWDSLEPRLEQLDQGYQNRAEMYAAAEPMARDFPWFGTGAGTFGTVFQLYLFSTETYWPEQLHNDWLETRITFGWLGLALLLAALACVGARWFFPGGLRGSRRLVVLAWLGLGGCLVHAWFDFPFQIHSTLFLFLVICALLFDLSRRPGGTRR